MFAIWAGETAWATLVVGAHMSREVCFAREGAGTEGALIPEVREEWRHDLVMVSAVTLFAEGLMFKRMSPSSVTALLMGVKFVEFMGGEGRDTEEGVEEDLRVFVIGREDRFDGERGERDVDDGQCEE